MKKFKILFFTLLALATGIVLAQLIKHDDGYVLIHYSDHVIEMTFWSALVAYCVFTIILVYLVKFIISLLRSVKTGRNWIAERTEKSSNKRFTDGLKHYFIGNWKIALKYLVNASKSESHGLLALLSAAESAHALHNVERARTLLTQATKKADSAGDLLLVDITQAKLQFKEKKYEPCLATLNHARVAFPNHPPVLLLLKDVYLKVSDWAGLNSILPEIKKQRLLPDDERDALETQVKYEILVSLAADDENDIDTLEKYWIKLSKLHRERADFIKCFVLALLKRRANDRAEQFLRQSLAKTWHSGLIELYGSIHTSNTQFLFVTAERWLKAHPDDPSLLLCLGQLSLKLKNWEKAQAYLNASLYLRESANTLVALAELFAEQNLMEKSVEYYRKALYLNKSTDLNNKLSLKNTRANMDSSVADTSTLEAPKEIGKTEEKTHEDERVANH